MAKTVATSSELEKRNLVANIAERGRKGYEARDVSVQPNKDLATAAAAATRNDNTMGNIPSEALASLKATTDAPAGSSARYAEAQRAIFDRGRGRESVYMGERYGAGHDRQVKGTNVALGKYGDQLAKADAARRAAASGPSFFPLGDPTDPAAANIDHRVQMGGSQTGYPDSTPGYGYNMETGLEAVGNAMDPDEMANFIAANDADPALVKYWGTQADDLWRDALNSRMTFQQAFQHIDAIVKSQDQIPGQPFFGFDDATAQALMTPYIYRWQSAFANVQSRNPEVGSATNAGYGPRSGVTQAAPTAAGPSSQANSNLREFGWADTLNKLSAAAKDAQKPKAPATPARPRQAR
jgi:hypothetical protein